MRPSRPLMCRVPSVCLASIEIARQVAPPTEPWASLSWNAGVVLYRCGRVVVSLPEVWRKRWRGQRLPRLSLGVGGPGGSPQSGQSPHLIPCHMDCNPIPLSPFGISHMALPLPAGSRNITSTPLVRQEPTRDCSNAIPRTDHSLSQLGRLQARPIRKISGHPTAAVTAFSSRYC